MKSSTKLQSNKWIKSPPPVNDNVMYLKDNAIEREGDCFRLADSAGAYSAAIRVVLIRPASTAVFMSAAGVKVRMHWVPSSNSTE